MRRYGVPEPYERLKSMTRGKSIGQTDVQSLVAGLEVPEQVKKRLLALSPAEYTGLAAELAKLVGAARRPENRPATKGEE